MLDLKSRCLIFLSLIYMSLNIVTPILGAKLVTLPIGFISGGILIGIIWYSLVDIIAEVYGMKFSVFIFFSSYTCQIIFSLICLGIIKLPSPQFWDGQHSYDFVLGHIATTSIMEFVATIAAWYANTYFLTKWKLLTNGKYFWLRSIGSSSIGIIIFSTIMYTYYDVTGALSFRSENLIIMYLMGLGVKLVYIAILAFPSNLMVIFLKIIQHSQAKNLNSCKL